MKHIIWQNIKVEVDDEFFDEEYPEMDEDERYYCSCEMNNDYLDDERMNCNVTLENPIIGFAEIDRWSRDFSRMEKVSGYRMYGNNLSDCLDCLDYDYAEFYTEDGEFKADFYHYAGAERYGIDTVIFRETRENFDEDEPFRMIDERTEKLGQYINNIYGWNDDNEILSMENMKAAIA